MIKSCKKPPVYFPTVTGAICSFNSQYADLPLKSHKIALTAMQSGSGTPSPDNVRPISGYSAINISQSGADTSTPTVHTITIGSTVYGGEYDAITGILTVTHGYADNFSTSAVGTSGSGIKYCDVSLLGITRNAKSISNIYDWVLADPPGVDGSFKSYSGAITFYDNRFTDVATANTILSDTQIVYELDTPQTIQLPPCLIDTLQGENNVWADTGNTTLEYLKAGR